MSAEPGVQEFQTRWELVIDLFEALIALGINCDIPAPSGSSNFIVVIEELADQGIDLHNEHDCYVFVMGVCNIVEILLTQVKLEEDDAHLFSELTRAVDIMCSILSSIRLFLPKAYFTRFLI